MIISRTPLRISFAGGGSDINWFYEKSPGAVVSTAINKYIYITVNKKFDTKIRVSYSHTEIVDNVTEIRHDIVRESLKLLGIDGGIEITSISDIPSEGTGLGSSSSYTVGLLHALHAYKGEFVSAERLAREACHIEIDILRKPIGKQDQYISAFGGLQYIQFNSDDSVFVEPIICNAKIKQKLSDNLIMFYTGLTRSADSILERQKDAVQRHADKFMMMQRMVAYAYKMRKVLCENELSEFGKILHENWLIKRELSAGISNNQIDLWYEKALEKGALGGKITGAGGGGFLVLYVPKSKQRKVISEIPLINSTFLLEPEGSKIIFVSN